MSDAASLEWIIEEEDAERPRALSDAQRAAIRVAIASALTADEVDRLEEMLEQGIIPGQETIPGQEPITGEDPAPAAHAGDAEDVDVAPEAVAAAPAAEVPLARGVEDAPVARGVEGARKRLRASEGAAPPASEGAADRRRPPAVESDLGAAALWAQRLLLSRFGCGSPGSAPRRLRGVAAPRRLFGVERQERDLYERLRVAATSAESTSIILCGARGSGKHTTLQSVLRRLRQTAPPGRPDADGATEDGAAAAEEAPLRKVPHFDVVRLSGLDHAQAAVGICELARQLLAVDDGQACRQRGAAASYWDNESLVRAELRRRRQTGAAPLLVVLSHFESFATRDTRQTLLYLLLDAIGDDGARIVIVGITADLHVLELLEKRVRSRLQNHHVVFPTARLPDVCGMLDDKMFLHLEDVDDDGDLWKEWPTFLEKHNTAWRLLRESEAFKTSMHDAVWVGRSMRWYAHVATHLVSHLFVAPVGGQAWLAAVAEHTPTSREAWRSAVAQLPPAQLVLVVAYLCFEIRETVPYNLELALASLARLKQADANAVPDDADLVMAHAALLASDYVLAPGSPKTAFDEVRLRYTAVRLAPSIGVDELWLALRKDEVHCSSALRRWALQS